MKNVSQYFPVRTIQTSTCLEFDNINEFCQFTKAHQLLDVFLLLNDQHEAEYFGIIHNHVLFRHATLGFKTLEDYTKASQNGFPDAALFYEAVQNGYHNYNDYKLVKEVGINDKAIFEKIKSLHFISGYDDFKSLLETDAPIPNMPSFSNPYELYKFATEKGFTDYTHFRTAVTKGFCTLALYEMACERNFPCYADFAEAADKGFKNYEDLKQARAYGIRTPAELYRFNDLGTIYCDSCTHDQKLMLSLLSKIEQGKKISINKVKDLLRSAIDEYRYEDGNEMFSWFTTSLDSDEALIGFLHKSAQAKKFGHYDMDGEFFEINCMKDRSVIIDGSNVAHNSQGSGISKPLVANIIKVIEHVKKEGFTDITVIADAALKHRLQDLNKLNQLKQMVTYLEAPRETAADVFLIQYVKKNHCLLISNDTFKEWKVQDVWTAENIDFYRLAFMIKDNQVLMPDLK